HREDDLIETAIINLLRGSGRKGLTSLKSRDRILRPLLRYKKVEIIKYAKDNNIEWREDSTNEDDSYLRNYVRHNIVSRLDSSARSQLLDIISRVSELNLE